MKKLILSLIALATFVIACQKSDIINEASTGKDSKMQLVSFTYGVSTAGDVHHLLFKEYFKRFPNDTLGIDTITVPIMDSFYKRVAKIVVDSNILQINPDSFMLHAITEEVNFGLFANGIRKMNNIVAMQIADVTNPSIRTVFNNIYSYSGSYSGYLTYINAQLATLQNLSTTDRQLVDLYESIITDSYITMGAVISYTDAQKAKLIVNADAVAGARAFKECLSNGTWLLGSVYVEYYCAAKGAVASAAMYAYLKSY